MGIIYGKHTEGWREAYEFASKEDKNEQVNEKIEVLEGFEIENPENYRSILNRAKTPVALDRACRTIICNNL